MRINYFNKLAFIIKFLQIESLNNYIQIMRQDDEDIVWNTRNVIDGYSDNEGLKDKVKVHKNIITTYNLIEEGLNYIVPSFWYLFV